MGSRVAPVIAILVLDRIERATIYNQQHFSVYLFKRYVDDCFVLLNKKDDPQLLLQLFNNAHSTIKFELEQPADDNSLNILDVNIKISPDGSTMTKFYEKPAKQKLFMNATSSQPKQMKHSAIRAEFMRINKLSSDTSVKTVAQNNFIDKLKKNGYKQKEILTIRKKRRNRQNTEILKAPIYVSIPFVSDNFQNKLSNIINQISREFNIPTRITNKSSNTLRNNLSKFRKGKHCNKRFCRLNNPALCLASYIVYYAKCSECIIKHDYVGSTKQYLHQRAEQHYNRPSEAIHQHLNTVSHNKNSPFVYSILSRCSSLKELVFKEGLWQKKLKPTLNCQHEREDVLQFLMSNSG